MLFRSTRAGGLESGLRQYLGVGNMSEGGGYVNRVLAEQSHLRKVVEGKSVAVNAGLPAANPVAVEPAAPAAPAAEHVALLR